MPRARTGDLGTTGTLKLIFGRYVAMDVATDGIAAVRVLGAAFPDCLLCDEKGWAATGGACHLHAPAAVEDRYQQARSRRNRGH